MSYRYLVSFDLQQLDRQVADFLVIGSGVAGLFAALRASQSGRVLLLTKDLLEGNTRHAQGGVAAAVGPDDDWRLHMEDTLEAGAGLCDEAAVAILVREGPERIRDLLTIGTRFDTVADSLALTREGGHGRRRVLHAGGDATGWEIERALAEAVLRCDRITLVAPATAVDLLTVEDECYGALAMDDAGQLFACLAKATIIATGGAGQVYSNTTNSPLVTGDGMAMAYRAGAELMDMEFYQFHPTALKVAGAPRSLITEAVRGEGALLLDHAGNRFMPAVHPLAELAPRDVVAKAMAQVMQESGTGHVWLDLRSMGNIDLPRRFPTVFQTCLKHGLDIRTDLIPVSPAAHYFMGGIRVDYQGRTNLRGLYACGEASCLALHGANRLASNSLLDGLVYGQRAAESAAHDRSEISQRQLLELDIKYAAAPQATAPEQAAAIRHAIQNLMWQKVGLVRDAAGLELAADRLNALRLDLVPGLPDLGIIEAENLLTVAQLITRAAALRTESRGGHFRVDCPHRDDAQWLKHIVLAGEQVSFSAKGEGTER
ncbi:MAG: L-aspartate oxidase [Bacillota bacterium]|jgi:L-aspartate oxidase